MKNFKIKVKSKHTKWFFPNVPQKDMETIMNYIFQNLNEREQKKVKIIIKSVDIQ